MAIQQSRCPLCGQLFPSEDMEYCTSCGRDVCEDDYNDQLDMCNECSTDSQDAYMEEDDEE